MAVRIDKLPKHIRKQVLEQCPDAGKKPSKFHNVRCEYDGIKFDSVKERNRYLFLLDMLRRNQISDLRVHHRWPLAVAGVHICTYIADFTYLDNLTETVIVEDVKGGKATITDVFRLKEKLMKAVHGITITIV